MGSTGLGHSKRLNTRGLEGLNTYLHLDIIYLIFGTHTLMGTRNKIVKLDMILPRLDDLWQYGSIVAALWSILHKLDIVTLKYDTDIYWIRLSLYCNQSTNTGQYKHELETT